MIQHGRPAAEPELAEVDVLKHLERAHAEQLGGAGHRGVQVVGPVSDVVQSADRRARGIRGHLVGPVPAAPPSQD